MGRTRAQLVPDTLRTLEQALEGLAYGSIQLVVHDSQIVRIERLERIRLPAAPDAAQAGLTGAPEAVPFTDGRPTAATEARHETVQEA